MGQNNESQALTPFLKEEEKKKIVVALPPLALQSSVFSPETTFESRGDCGNGVAVFTNLHQDP